MGYGYANDTFNLTVSKYIRLKLFWLEVGYSFHVSITMFALFSKGSMARFTLPRAGGPNC